MSVESVRELFRSENLEHLVKYSEVISDTVSNAAVMYNCEMGQIAKTMSFLVNEEAIVVVMAGDVKIDNAKYRHTFKVKAKMIPFDLAEEYTGHIPGGISPFALKEGVKVFLDESLKRYDISYAGAGDEHNTVEVAIPLLERLSKYESWVDVTKVIE